MSRYFHAAKTYDVDVIIRLTGDNPCVDHGFIRSILDVHIENENDCTKTKSYPVGMNVEIVSFRALEKALEHSKDALEREHVTPFIYKHPDIFKIHIIEAPVEHRRPEIRVTLDTEEDYALLCAIFDHFKENNFFGVREIVALFDEKPWLALINKKVAQKEVFETIEDEIKEAIRILDLQDLKKAKEILASRLK